MNKTLDCKNTAEQYTYSPLYYACFGHNSLPSSFRATVGPTTSVNPSTYDCVANGWPGSAIEVSLTRVDPCTYAWGWSNGTGGYLLLSTGTPPPLNCNANMPNITQPTTNGTFWYILDGQNLSGSCTYNEETHTTQFLMTGQVANSAGCIMNFTINYP